MLTRSFIAMETKEGFKYVYCHFDGYESNVGLKLYKYFNKKEDVEKLIDGGDFSSLYINVDEIENFDKYEHYLIDEIQFHNTQFIDKLIRAIGEAKSAFYTFGITADVYSRLWHNNARLIPYADEIVLLKTDCELCEKAKCAIYNVG